MTRQFRAANACAVQSTRLLVIATVAAELNTSEFEAEPERDEPLPSASAALAAAFAAAAFAMDSARARMSERFQRVVFSWSTVIFLALTVSSISGKVILAPIDDRLDAPAAER